MPLLRHLSFCSYNARKYNGDIGIEKHYISSSLKLFIIGILVVKELNYDPARCGKCDDCVLFIYIAVSETCLFTLVQVYRHKPVIQCLNAVQEAGQMKREKLYACSICCASDAHAHTHTHGMWDDRVPRVWRP